MWIVTITFPMRSEILPVVIGFFVFLTLAPVVEASEQTTIQRVVPFREQGRVFGFAQSLETAASPITAFLIGPIAEFWVIPSMTGGALADHRRVVRHGAGAGDGAHLHRGGGHRPRGHAARHALALVPRAVGAVSGHAVERGRRPGRLDGGCLSRLAADTPRRTEATASTSAAAGSVAAWAMDSSLTRTADGRRRSRHSRRWSGCATCARRPATTARRTMRSSRSPVSRRRPRASPSTGSSTGSSGSPPRAGTRPRAGTSRSSRTARSTRARSPPCWPPARTPSPARRSRRRHGRDGGGRAPLDGGPPRPAAIRGWRPAVGRVAREPDGARRGACPRR